MNRLSNRTIDHISLPIEQFKIKNKKKRKFHCILWCKTRRVWVTRESKKRYRYYSHFYSCMIRQEERILIDSSARKKPQQVDHEIQEDYSFYILPSFLRVCAYISRRSFTCPIWLSGGQCGKRAFFLSIEKKKKNLKSYRMVRTYGMVVVL